MQQDMMVLGGVVALMVLGLVAVLQRHKKQGLAWQDEVDALQQELQDKKTLIDTQMHDLTQQMLMQTSLQERLQHAERDATRAQQELATLEQDKQSIQDKQQAMQVELGELKAQLHAEQQAMVEKTRLLEAAKQHVLDEVSELKQVVAEKDAAYQSLQSEHQQVEVRLSALNTQLKAEQEAAVEKLAMLEEAKGKMMLQFKELADQVLEEKGKAMDEGNQKNLDAVLRPMREQLGVFRQRVDEIHQQDSNERAALREHLNQLQQLNHKMSEEANNLTHALKGDSKVQGCWGEMILEKILESSGLREGHEFKRESSFVTEEGQRFRPDVVIHMPGDKHIIIDAKVSLKDYERLISSHDKAEKDAAMKAHLRSLKSHIQGLSGKNYAHLPGVHSPDYVLMFMPIEGAYLMAIEADSSIFEEAFEKHIAVVTPSTLYATLKLIEQLWRYERQSENVAALIDRAAKLHDKMAGFIKTFEEIGQRLGQAQTAYDSSIKCMSSGTGNVVRQIHQLGELAGKTKKKLPEHLLAESARDALMEGKES